MAEAFDMAWGVVKYNPEDWGDVDPDFDRPFSEEKAPNLAVKPSQPHQECAMCGEEALFFIDCKSHPSEPHEWHGCNFCSKCASQVASDPDYGCMECKGDSQ